MQKLCVLHVGAAFFVATVGSRCARVWHKLHNCRADNNPQSQSETDNVWVRQREGTMELHM